MLTKTQIKYAEFYLEWFNDYLTVQKMAEHKGMSVREAQSWITLGRDCHNQLCIEATKEGEIEEREYYASEARRQEP